MPFVKLDCGMLDSSIWPDKCARELFITALLMAEPFELRKEVQQIKCDSLELEDCTIEPGWYGRVQAAGIGIINRAMIDRDEGMEALKRLCACDPESRSEEHCGKRMARINGGYLILNYDKYRQKDYTTAERSRRYREKKKLLVTRDITQAEAEANTESKVSKESSNHSASSVDLMESPESREAENFSTHSPARRSRNPETPLCGRSPLKPTREQVEDYLQECCPLVAEYRPDLYDETDWSKVQRWKPYIRGLEMTIQATRQLP